MRLTAVLKENVELTRSPEEVRVCWYRNFTKILNIPSEFHEDVIACMQSHPTLFNIYYSAVVANWREHSPTAGVNVKYKHGPKLVRNCTAKARLSEVRIRESQFLQMILLYIYATTRYSFEETAGEFICTVED